MAVQRETILLMVISSRKSKRERAVSPYFSTFEVNIFILLYNLEVNFILYIPLVLSLCRCIFFGLHCGFSHPSMKSPHSTTMLVIVLDLTWFMNWIFHAPKLLEIGYFKSNYFQLSFPELFGARAKRHWTENRKSSHLWSVLWIIYSQLFWPLVFMWW